MNSKLEYILKKFNRPDKQCINCIYGKFTKKGKVFCFKTKKKPDFYPYCPNFKLYGNSQFSDTKLLKISNLRSLIIDKIINPNNDLSARATMAMLMIPVIATSLLFTYSLGLKNHILTIILVSIFILFIVAFIFAQIKKVELYRLLLPNPLVSKKTHLPYYYIVLTLDLIKEKENSGNTDLRIIEQTITRVFGPRYLKFAKHFMNYGTRGEIDGKYFAKYAQKMKYDYRILLFTLIAEMYAHNNLSNFTKSDILRKKATLLDIYISDYQEIKELIKNKEYEREQKIKEEKRQREAEERRQRQYNWQNHRSVTRAYKNYYKVIDLQSDCSIQEIKKQFKKLALQYHPDRYVGKSEKEQLDASEKFKEISEAYNILKKRRGF